jgi:hypothetical protein
MFCVFHYVVTSSVLVSVLLAFIFNIKRIFTFSLLLLFVSSCNERSHHLLELFSLKRKSSLRKQKLPFPKKNLINLKSFFFLRWKLPKLVTWRLRVVDLARKYFVFYLLCLASPLFPDGCLLLFFLSKLVGWVQVVFVLFLFFVFIVYENELLRMSHSRQRFCLFKAACQNMRPGYLFLYYVPGLVRYMDDGWWEK